MRMVVVLPAPLAPTKPTTRPWSMEKETPSTARSWPKWRWRFSTRMAGSDMIGKGQGTGPQRMMSLRSQRMEGSVSTRPARGSEVVARNQRPLGETARATMKVERSMEGTLVRGVGVPVVTVEGACHHWSVASRQKRESRGKSKDETAEGASGEPEISMRPRVAVTDLMKWTCSLRLWNQSPERSVGELKAQRRSVSPEELEKETAGLEGSKAETAPTETVAGWRVEKELPRRTPVRQICS